MIWLKTVGIIYKKLKAYILKIGGCEVPAVGGCGGSCSHFWEVHGGQFFLNMYKDIKTDEKKTYTLRGHGITKNDPTNTRKM